MIQYTPYDQLKSYFTVTGSRSQWITTAPKYFVFFYLGVAYQETDMSRNKNIFIVNKPANLT